MRYTTIFFIHVTSYPSAKCPNRYALISFSCVTGKLCSIGLYFQCAILIHTISILSSKTRLLSVGVFPNKLKARSVPRHLMALVWACFVLCWIYTVSNVFLATSFLFVLKRSQPFTCAALRRVSAFSALLVVPRQLILIHHSKSPSVPRIPRTFRLTRATRNAYIRPRIGQRPH